MDRQLDPGHDPERLVVVPLRPGPVTPLDDGRRRPDEVDELLDELFGPDDGSGPGPFDLALLGGGATLVVWSTLASGPGAALWAGLLAVALGLVLPVRWLVQRVGARRRTARSRHRLDHGRLLRVDHESTRRLLEAHRSLTAAGAGLAADRRTRADEVAHAALVEVATLLDGTVPTTSAQRAYVDERTAALDRLTAVLADPEVGDGEAAHRDAVVEARRELDALGPSSSVNLAEQLADDLRPHDPR